jgi:5-methylcytosine-specific restriction endonuclease McrA
MAIDEQATFEKFGYRSTDWKSKPIVAVCDICGKVRVLRKCEYVPLCKSCALRTESFRLHNSQTHRGKKYSRETIEKRLKTFCEPGRQPGRKKGLGLRDKNSNWRGGITLHPFLRLSLENKNWREQVFERDNYTCRGCSERGGQLEAHHIKAFAVLLQEFFQYYSDLSPIENRESLIKLAINWTPFWNIENGKTLCKPCHIEEHRRLKKLAKQQKLILEKNK